MVLEGDAALLPSPRSHTLAKDPETGRLAQLVRAPALQAGCRGFESLTAHQNTWLHSNLFVVIESA